MDPLSLTVGAIALGGFCRKILQGLRVLESLSNVPDDIAVLIDELRDFQNVLTTICRVTKQVPDEETQNEVAAKLKPLLVKASSVIAAIATHCGIPIHDHSDLDDTTTPSSAFNPNPSASGIDLLTRFRWLKDQKKIEQYCRRLKIVRLNIAAQLTSLNLLNSYSILAEIRELTTVCRRMSIDRQFSVSSVSSNDSCGYLSDEKVATVAMGLQSEEDEKSRLVFEPETVDTPPPYQRSAVAEMSNCNCACHRLTTLQSLQIATSLFGSLKLRVGGLPVLGPACDQIACERNKKLFINASFRLPTWISNRSIDMLLKANLPIGPQLTLFSTRTISRNSDIFCFAMQGDVAGIKRLFTNGLASPHDSSHNYGYTALHYAADYGHLDLCKFLIKAGAKADLLDFDNKTPTDLAFNKLISSNHQSLDDERVQEIFDEEAWLEQKQFTLLHQIVVGVAKTSRTLVDELLTTVKDVNTGDCEGRTPLSWAAERCDLDAVRSLIKFGASLDQSDRDGNTPVHYACKSKGGPAALSIMLNAGASPIKRNKWKQTPLNWASFFQDDPEFVQCLLFHPQVSILTDRDHYGSTPVGNAAFSSHAKMLTFLIESGADPDTGLEDGEIPFLDCISRNAHECIKVLLDKAPVWKLNLAFEDYNGENCLHYLARRADLETISIFLNSLKTEKMDLSGLRSSRVGRDGLTPRNLLALRGDDKIQRALEKVLAWVDREAASEASSVTSDEAAYVDAFDLLPQWEEDIGLKEPVSVVCEVFD